MDATYKQCPECGERMSLQTGTDVFEMDGEEFEISGIKQYRCDNCGEVVLTSTEARSIINTLAKRKAPINLGHQDCHPPLV